MKQKYFIVCLIFLFFNFKLLGAQDTSEIVKVPSWVFEFDGVETLNSPVQLELTDDEVDLTSIKHIFERVKESHYENFSNMNLAVSTIHNRIDKLCHLQEKNEVSCKNNSKRELKNIVNDIRGAMSGRILYPEGYGKNIDGFFKTAIELFNSDCKVKNCSDSDVTIIYGSEEQYRQLYNKIQAEDKHCQKDVLTGMAKTFKYFRFPKKCLQETNKNHPVCKNMLEDIKTIKNRFLELSELAYGEEALTTTEAQAICFECISVPGSEMFKVMRDLLQTINEPSQCFELQAGEEKMIQAGTGDNETYIVQREIDGSYSVPLTLEFVPSGDYDGYVTKYGKHITKEEVPEYYMGKVQRCIDVANTKMLGPNGEKLQIVINEPSQTNTCNTTDVKEIFIGSKDHRSNAGKYEADIDCETITHEILHLLGLCDEYQERLRGFYVDSKTGEVKSETSNYRNEKSVDDKDYEFKSAYDCRVTHSNSIMSDQYVRWSWVFTSSASEENNSLLEPGHFNSILYGSCSEKNKTFNECSQLAYRSSIHEEKCLEKKSQCELQNILGRNKQEEIEKVKDDIDMFTFLKERREKKGQNTKKAEEKIDTLTKRLRQLESWPDL